MANTTYPVTKRGTYTGKSVTLTAKQTKALGTCIAGLFALEGMSQPSKAATHNHIAYLVNWAHPRYDLPAIATWLATLTNKQLATTIDAEEIYELADGKHAPKGTKPMLDVIWIKLMGMRD